MILHTLHRTYRNFTKDKFFASLNIVGLAIGMSVFLLIALYVKFEKSYEDFVPDAESVYRVGLHSYVNNELMVSSAENYPAVGPALVNELPEVLSYARLYNMGYKNNVIITNEDAPQPISIKHRKFLYADSAFLSMMGYELLHGDVTTALAQPNSAVITQHYARLYFGDQDPIGKSLRMQDDDNNNELVKVTGVIREVPANTHLKFDILFSYKTLHGRKRNNQENYAIDRYERSWQRNDMYTFIRVRPGTDPASLEAKFPSIIQKYKPEIKEQNEKDILSLQSVRDIHLASNLSDEPETNGDAKIVQFLGIIGIFVLVIAWINYINLATAKAMERAKEVGVQKVMGASKYQLINQFLTEASLVNLVALLIAFSIVGIVLPSFNTLSGLALDMHYVIEPTFLGLGLLLWIGGTLLSGFYPAIILSSFRPAMVLKGKLKNSVRGVFFRKSLVVFQFMASVSLIAGTLIVYNQLDYMMNRDIGMNIDQVLVVERPGIGPYRSGFNESIEVFRNELKKDPTIEFVTVSGTIPGMQRAFATMMKPYGASDDKMVGIKINGMDYEFMEVFKMNLLAGRTFSEDYTNDPDTAIILTESAAKLMGYERIEKAIGQTVTIPQFEWNPIVVGVVNDYHQVSLKKPLEPTFFYCNKYEGEYYSLRIHTTDLNATIEHVEASWQKAFPGNPFDYFFLDDYFNQQYQNERQFGMLFSTFASLALIIGCLGLLGLSAYTATQRTKEIGIRKVLGSTERGIFVLLSSEYIKLVVIAIVLAVPLVYLIMNNWIQRFPYHITITGFVFIVAGGVVLLISLLTVSVQTIRAARANPVDSLRYE
ncbi:MAG TPA: ABC transporter permease [Ohtaekwangia sp.]|nr:ABC transporter permease [Ohtaekwangia sp.]